MGRPKRKTNNKKKTTPAIFFEHAFLFALASTTPIPFLLLLLLPSFL